MQFLFFTLKSHNHHHDKSIQCYRYSLSPYSNINKQHISNLLFLQKSLIQSSKSNTFVWLDVVLLMSTDTNERQQKK